MTDLTNSGFTRRGLLAVFAATAVAAAPTCSNAFGLLRGAGDVRRIRMYSGRTGETMNTIYWIEGEYIPEALNEPQVRHRDMVRRYEHPAAGAVSLVMSPFRFGGRGANSERPPPMLGEHTDQVLAEFGVSATEAADLRGRGIVA